MPSVRPALTGKFGRYEILCKIGEGGMGTVYLAEDTKLGRRVALKVPHFSEDVQPLIMQRFIREARVAAKVNHANLCTIFDADEVEGVHFISMPYIEGTTLASTISSQEPWPTEKALRLVHRLATALHFLHSNGIVHRDLKPGNVMLRTDGEPVVMDFGIARNYDSQTNQLTAEGMAVGTPVYMSPEQLMGEVESVGPRSDVYSLGVILYQMLTGRLPFEGPLESVYAQILHREPLAPSRHSSVLDPQIDAICMKAIAKEKDERFSSMLELAHAIEARLGTSSDLTAPIFSPFSGDLATIATVSESDRETPGSDVGDPTRLGEHALGTSPTAPPTTLTRVLDFVLPLLPWAMTMGFFIGSANR